MTDTAEKRPATTHTDPTARPSGWHVECPRCGHSYLAYRSEIMAGTWMKRCGVCYDGGNALSGAYPTRPGDMEGNPHAGEPK